MNYVASGVVAVVKIDSAGYDAALERRVNEIEGVFFRRDLALARRSLSAWIYSGVRFTTGSLRPTRVSMSLTGCERQR